MRYNQGTGRYQFRPVPRACGEPTQAVFRSYKMEQSQPVEPVGWTCPKSKVPDAVGTNQGVVICRVLRRSMNTEADSSPTANWTALACATHHSLWLSDKNLERPQ